MARIKTSITMDYTRSPILSLLRGPLLFTPQGWVVVFTLVACWSWAAVVWASGNNTWPFGADVGRTLGQLIVWPLLVFLFYIRLCMPHFRTSWRDTALLALSALALPLFHVVSAL